MLKKIKAILKKFGVHTLFAFFQRLFYEWIVPHILVVKVQACFYLKQHFALTAKNKANLDGDLIISLTSYPPRFKTLHLTLQSLLLQNVAYDKLILWIAEKDKELIPAKVLSLRSKGLIINFCEDTRSYKKIIPVLQQFPNAYIVTVDDDTYYWDTWLKNLIEDHEVGKKEIIGYRGHLIQCAADGKPLPYRNWKYEGALSTPSPLNFLTGVGGVLYPPRTLYHQVTDQKLFMKLCPQADDIWLYFMARINGTDIRRVHAKKRYFYFWPTTLTTGLAGNNVFNNGNDNQINKLNEYYKLFN
jgi:hypothetical protein